MREIKFRAWLKKDETMYHVRTVNFDKEIVFLIEFDNEDDMAFHEHFNQIELMQYTGLKDCQGKEIYEGDILRVRKEYYGKSHRPTYVLYEDGCFRRQISNIHNPVALSRASVEALEVIGNIYETPKLLEV